MKLIRNWLGGYGMSAVWVDVLSTILLVAIISLLCLIANVLTKQVLLRLIDYFLKKYRFKWEQFLMQRKVFRVLSHIVPALIIYSSAMAFPAFQKLIETAALTYFAIVLIATINRMLSVLDDIYQTYEISKTKPIKGYIQVVKIIVILIGVILMAARWMDKSPVILLSGIGALSAVFLLVFRDSLLGLAAGVQLSANDMVRMGDWIEMPNYEADGEVIDISLNTVMVRNFDRTVTMIPSYALISSSFKNWRGMQESGGRRVKRSLLIDVTSIQTCSDEMIERFKQIDLLGDYIIGREQEIAEYNTRHHGAPDNPVNGRALTNVGVFRAYVTQYLINHPGIHAEAMLMVRQLAPGKDGLPLEIYAFTKSTQATEYESVQADIFDHLFAVAGYFDLRIFQNPTGYDIERMNRLENKGEGDSGE